MTLARRTLIALAILLAAEAAGVAVLTLFTGIIRGWLLAWPPPTEHFASLVGDLAWPFATLLIIYLFRRPLTLAANHLARRFQRDRIRVGGGLFEIDAATTLIPLNEADRDHQLREQMWEFVGASDDNWNRLVDWIGQRIAPGLDLEDFLSESIFAPERELAYRELVEGR